MFDRQARWGIKSLTTAPLAVLPAIKADTRRRSSRKGSEVIFGQSRLAHSRQKHHGMRRHLPGPCRQSPYAYDPMDGNSVIYPMGLLNHRLFEAAPATRARRLDLCRDAAALLPRAFAGRQLDPQMLPDLDPYGEPFCNSSTCNISLPWQRNATSDVLRIP